MPVFVLKEVRGVFVFPILARLAHGRRGFSQGNANRRHPGDGAADKNLLSFEAPDNGAALTNPSSGDSRKSAIVILSSKVYHAILTYIQ
jgi:hypothetical protein